MRPKQSDQAQNPEHDAADTGKANRRMCMPMDAKESVIAPSRHRQNRAIGQDMQHRFSAFRKEDFGVASGEQRSYRTAAFGLRFGHGGLHWFSRVFSPRLLSPCQRGAKGERSAARSPFRSTFGQAPVT